MFKHTHSFAACALLASGLALASLSAVAADAPGEHWRETHPRRAEVNSRLAKQDARIHHEVREGELTHAQAAQLHQDDHAIRQQERQMAAAQGGHITKRQQRQLNREENAVSRDIPR